MLVGRNEDHIRSVAAHSIRHAFGPGSSSSRLTEPAASLFDEVKPFEQLLAFFLCYGKSLERSPVAFGITVNGKVAALGKKLRTGRSEKIPRIVTASPGP